MSQVTAADAERRAGALPIAVAELDEDAAAHLTAIVEAITGARQAVVEAVLATPAKLRGPVGTALDTWHLAWRHPRFARDEDPVYYAYRLASVGLATTAAKAAFRMLWQSSAPTELAGDYAALLGGRGRVWLTRFTTSVLRSRHRNRALMWHLVRRLVDGGLIDPPTHPHHVLDVLSVCPWRELPTRAADDPAVAAALRDLFRTAGAGLLLAQHIHHQAAEAWDGLLIAWGRDDPDRRSNLLDDCLAALGGGVPDRDARGFIEVHKRCRFTLDEAAERQERYLTLLHSPVTTTVALARADLRRLLDAARLDATGLLEVTPDVIVRHEKVVVREHLRLLTDALADGAVDPAACADAVVGGLDPDRIDVALRVARLLRRCTAAAPQAQERITSALAAAVPLPTPELRSALGPLAAPEPAHDGREHRPTGPDAADAPARDEAAPADLPEPGHVEPVRDLAELIALLEEMPTTGATALDVERALDGMVRLRMDPPDAWDLAQALYHRPCNVEPLRAALGSWAGRPPPEKPRLGHERGVVLDPTGLPSGVEVTEYAPANSVASTWHWHRTFPVWNPDDLVDFRLRELRRHLRNAPAPALATPTHEDGTLTADELLRRLRARADAGVGTPPHDLGTALLRLRPADRAALLDPDAIEPGTAERLAIVGRPMTWHRRTTEVRSCHGGGLEPQLISTWASPESTTGTPDDPVRAWLDSDLSGLAWDRARAHFGFGFDNQEGVLDIGIWALTLPSHPDILAVHLQRLLVEALENDRLDVSPVAALLGSYRRALGSPAVHVLVVAGATGSARGRTSAAEALAGACSRGLVRPGTLAEALQVALDPAAAPHGFPQVVTPAGVRPKANRVAATLTDASRIDDATGRVVLDALAAALGPLSQLRGGIGLIELTARLAERFRARIELPEPLATLAAGRSTSRTAQEARRIAAAADR